MKINLNNPRFKQILKEELERAKRILVEGYSADEVWDTMSDEDKDAALYVAKAENPEELRVGSWDSIPADIQDTIDLSDYELAKYDQGGRTNLRAIEQLIKKSPNLDQIVNKFLSRTGRSRRNDLTIKQSYQLLKAIHEFMNKSNPSQSSADTTADDVAKRNFMDTERGAGRNSGLD